MCAGAIAWAQVSRLVYAASDPKKGYNLIQQPILHPKTEVVKGIMENESSALLKEFFERKRWESEDEIQNSKYRIQNSKFIIQY